MNDEPINLLRAAEKPPLSPETQPSKRFNLSITILVIFLVFLGGFSYALVYFSERNQPLKITYNEKILKPRKLGIFETVKNFFFHSDSILEGQKEDRINILLLGMGGPGHDGAYLTDTNIIVSIKPSTNEVAMVSIPRDLGVKIPGYGGIRKINSVNALGETQEKAQGGEFARKFFSDTFDISIPYYIRIDFKAFEEIINAVGGVTIDVPRSFTDTSYPGPNDSYQVISFEAGKQTMNGERALIYSRSRHGGNGEGSDFARARRQQQILSALKEKMLSVGTYTSPTLIKKISDSLSEHVTTNLDLKQILYLASIGKDIDNTKIKNLVIDNSQTGYLISYSVSTLLPRGGNFNVINSAIKNIFEPTGTIPVVATPVNISNVEKQEQHSNIFPNAKIEVQNGTWQMGLATRVKKQLQNMGLDVYSVGNSAKRPIPTTTIYIIKQSTSDQIVTTLSKELKANVSTSLPEWLQTELSVSDTEKKFKSDTDILVILGNDIRERFNL